MPVKNKLKIGISIIEVVLITIFIMMFTGIVVSESNYLYYSQRVNFETEVNSVLNNYLEKAKEKCRKDGEFDYVDEVTTVLFNHEKANVSYKCEQVSNNLYKTTVIVNYDNNTKTKTGEGYVYR